MAGQLDPLEGLGDGFVDEDLHAVTASDLPLSSASQQPLSPMPGSQVPFDIGSPLAPAAQPRASAFTVTDDDDGTPKALQEHPAITSTSDHGGLEGGLANISLDDEPAAAASSHSHQHSSDIDHLLSSSQPQRTEQQSFGESEAGGKVPFPGPDPLLTPIASVMDDISMLPTPQSTNMKVGTQ